jgi:hypothetical protein
VRSPSDAPYTVAAGPAGPASTTSRSNDLVSVVDCRPMATARPRIDGSTWGVQSARSAARFRSTRACAGRPRSTPPDPRPGQAPRACSGRPGCPMSAGCGTGRHIPAAQIADDRGGGVPTARGVLRSRLRLCGVRRSLPMCRSRAGLVRPRSPPPIPQPEWPVGEWAEGWVEGVGLGNQVQSGLFGGQVRIALVGPDEGWIGPQVRALRAG